MLVFERISINNMVLREKKTRLVFFLVLSGWRIDCVLPSVGVDKSSSKWFLFLFLQSQPNCVECFVFLYPWKTSYSGHFNKPFSGLQKKTRLVFCLVLSGWRIDYVLPSGGVDKSSSKWFLFLFLQPQPNCVECFVFLYPWKTSYSGHFNKP